mmetsp:Transcript_43883/g.50765  ORF Transcript_43883/g.50765 Transcript_43883/m.50765 type:complete len:97 (+) Transcript_43883:379-669(+)
MKNRDLRIYYLLSMEGRPLGFLRDGAFVVPHISKQATSSTQLTRSLEAYEFQAALGQGGFATVYLARKKLRGKFFAVKQIKKKKFNSNDRKSLLQE